MKVFISGPMKNDPNHQQRFKEWEDRINSLGQSPFNPAWMQVDKSWNRNELLNIDRAAMDACDIVIFLSGWERASGCHAEMKYALGCSKFIFFEDYLRKGLTTASPEHLMGGASNGTYERVRQFEDCLMEQLAKESTKKHTSTYTDEYGCTHISKQEEK